MVDDGKYICYGQLDVLPRLRLVDLVPRSLEQLDLRECTTAVISQVCDLVQEKPSKTPDLTKITLEFPLNYRISPGHDNWPFNAIPPQHKKRIEGFEMSEIASLLEKCRAFDIDLTVQYANGYNGRYRIEICEFGDL